MMTMCGEGWEIKEKEGLVMETVMVGEAEKEEVVTV